MGEPFCYFKMNSRPSCLNGSQLHISGIVITEGKAKIYEGRSFLDEEYRKDEYPFVCTHNGVGYIFKYDTYLGFTLYVYCLLLPSVDR